MTAHLPLLVTSGEPAGIGPDIIIQQAQQYFNYPWVVLGDPEIFASRAKLLGLPLEIQEIRQWSVNTPSLPGVLRVWPISVREPVIPGRLSQKNADYVWEMLQVATDACLSHQVAALITAPVHKAILNQAGYSFVGHTHYLAEKSGVDDVTMFFHSPWLRLALVTDHLPLTAVSQYITAGRLESVLRQVHHALQYYFRILFPAMGICGLNPHAGEEGYLGDEEKRIMRPVIDKLIQQGYRLSSPLSADTAFLAENRQNYDVMISMYHDQGLAIFKYLSFGKAANITLGLPFLRTSVDHGVALHLAGTGKASAQSLHYTFTLTCEMLHATFSP